MAKDDVTMPQSMAGLQRFTNDDPAKIKLKPATVLIILAIVVILVIVLHFIGDQLFGVASSSIA